MFNFSKYILSWRNDPKNEKFNFNMATDIDNAKTFLGDDLLDIWYMTDRGFDFFTKYMPGLPKTYFAIVKGSHGEMEAVNWKYGVKSLNEDIKLVAGNGGAMLIRLSDVLLFKEQEEENVKIADFLMNLRDEFYDKMTENELRGVYFQDKFISSIGKYDDVIKSVVKTVRQVQLDELLRQVRLDELLRTGEFVLFNKNTKAIQKIKFEVLRDLLFGAKYS